MSKFCQNCGTENEDNATFCKSCGTALVVTDYDQQANQANYQNNMNNQGMNNYQNNMNNLNLLPNRNIVMCIILSILTCGIYLFYWDYKQGQRLYQAGKNYGLDIKDNSILYLILSLIGFSLVSSILIQADLNKFSNGN